MATNDTQRIAEHARRIVHIKQFSNLALHILVSSVGSGLKAAETLVNVNLQKSLARDIRVWEAAAEGDENVVFHPISGRWAAPQKRKGTKPHEPHWKGKPKTTVKGKGKGKARRGQEDDDEDDDEDYDDEVEGGRGGGGGGGSGLVVPEGRFGEKPVAPTKPSPVLTAYFGAIMCLGRSFQSGICKPAFLPSPSSSRPFLADRIPPVFRLPPSSSRYEPRRSSHLPPPRHRLRGSSFPETVRQ